MSCHRDAVAGPGIDLNDPFLLDFVSDKSSKIGPFEIADDYPFDFVPSARKTLAIRSWVSGRPGYVPWMDFAIAILNFDLQKSETPCPGCQEKPHSHHSPELLRELELLQRAHSHCKLLPIRVRAKTESRSTSRDFAPRSGELPITSNRRFPTATDR